MTVDPVFAPILINSPRHETRALQKNQTLANSGNLAYSKSPSLMTGTYLYILSYDDNIDKIAQ
jgi:hypothetical protein